MKHVCTFSYGVASWAAAKLVAQKHGTADMVILFTDTKYEDEDTYAWGRAAAKNVGAELVEIADGRDPWQVFFDVKMLGNTRADPCSRVLKREMLARWLAENCDPADTTVYFGIHWSEGDRFERIDRDTGERKGIRPRMAAMGWTAAAPLCDPPLLAASELHEWAKREGLWVQRLYQLGFPHGNCGGRCVKQGLAGWRLLLKTMPQRYTECEIREEEFRRAMGKDVAILRDRQGGTTRPLTLRQFREREQRGGQCDLSEDYLGGCSCFAGDE